MPERQNGSCSTVKTLFFVEGSVIDTYQMGGSSTLFWSLQKMWLPTEHTTEIDQNDWVTMVYLHLSFVAAFIIFRKNKGGHWWDKSWKHICFLIPVKEAKIYSFPLS